MRRVFEGEAPEVDEKSLRYTIDKLREALYEGYGERAHNLQFGTPDEEMVSNLQNNIYQFSVAKNHQSLRDLQKALVNSDGKIATFTEFREAARKIDQRYNITYLQTEYDTAISSAQMAAHWARFGQGKTDPMLRYVTAGDERVRHSHAELNGLQRPMSDPIWNMIYPPNGWNCRCTVVEVNGKPTPPGELRLPGDVPSLFRTNLAKTGMLFPEGHPYFIGLDKLPKEQRQELITYADSLFIDDEIKGLNEKEAKHKLRLLIRDVISKEIGYDTLLSLPKDKERKDIPLKVTPFSVKSVIKADAHSKTIESKKAFLNAIRNVDAWEYSHSKPLGFGKDKDDPKNLVNVTTNKVCILYINIITFSISYQRNNIGTKPIF